MNKYHIFVIALTLVFLLSGCSKKEGSISHREKIQTVTADEHHYQDDQLYYSLEEYVEEAWNWDGNELYRIDYQGQYSYSENFFYDRKNRLKSTTVPAYGIRREFFYSGKELDHIDTYKDMRLVGRMSFTHTDGVLTEIAVDRWLTDDADSVVDFIMRKSLGAWCSKSASCRYQLQWNENDVVRIDCQGADTTYSISLTYDKKNNPYHQLFGYQELNDPIFGFEMLSQHNVETIHMPFGKIKDQLFSFQYKYDGNYPAERTLTYKYNTVSNTFDSVEYKVVKKEKYTYK